MCFELNLQEHIEWSSQPVVVMQVKMDVDYKSPHDITAAMRTYRDKELMVPTTTFQQGDIIYFWFVFVLA
jgi:hypothetical protein